MSEKSTFPWRWVAWAAIALVLALQFRMTLRGCWRDADNPDRTSDFTAFYAAGTLALEGKNIYDFRSSGISRRPFLYPPLFAVVPMMPLALLPHNVALTIFALLNCALLLGMSLLLHDALWHGVARPPPWSGNLRDWRGLLRQPPFGVGLAVLGCFLFIDGNNRMGNANLFVAFPLALALWLLLRFRTVAGKVAAGGAIALATAIKVTPGLFGLYLLWSRRGWAMLGGALGLLVFLLLVPGLGLGFSNALDRLREFRGHAESAVSGEGRDDDVLDHPGAERKQLVGGYGFPGLLMHYFTDKPLDWKLTRHGVRYEGQYRVNFVNLTPERAQFVLYVVSGLFGLLTVALTWSAAARQSREGLALSFSLVTVAMLLLAPLTRWAHLCALLISFAVLIALMQQGRIAGRVKSVCIVSMAALFLTGIVLSPDAIGLPAHMWTEVVGVNSFLLMGLYAANAWALLRLRDESADH